MKTVLIFAHECAPYHRPQSTIGAQRPAQFARHLPAFGWRAIVICCAQGQRESLDRKDLARVRYATQEALAQAEADTSFIIPTPSLIHDGWLDRAWRATLPARAPRRAPLRKLLTAVKFATGDWSQSWQPCAQTAADVVAEQVKIDVCLAEHSPDASFFLARWFKKKYGVPWLADLRDPVLRPFQGATRRVYARVARHLVAGAAGTIAVTPVWAEMDAQLFGKPSRCISNGYDPTEYAPSAPRRHERLIIGFAGNIRETFDIFMDGLKLAAERLPPAERRALCFRYWGIAHEKVAQKAAQAGLSDLCEIQPHGPRETVLHALNETDLLLLLTLPRSSQRDPYLAQGLYPGKVFEYFGVQRPILCVPDDGGLLDDLLRRSRTGVAAGTPRAVADYLLETLRHWQKGGTIPYQPDAVVLQSYTRQHLTEQLAQALTSASNLRN